MNLLKKTIYILFFLFISISVNAQDPLFSQYYATPLFISPSFAGATAGGRLTVNYRNQWPSIPGSFNTYGFSWDHYFPTYKSGIGLLAYKDEAGAGRLGRTNFTFQYAYSIDISEDWIVSPGLSISYSQNSIDFDNLEFASELDFDKPIPYSGSFEFEKISYFDAATSVIAYSDKYWAGATIDHLSQPNQSLLSGVEARIPVKFLLFGGTKLGVRNVYGRKGKENIFLTFLYRSQGKFDQMNIGAYWYINPLMFGIWYRGLPVIKSYSGYWNHDAVILMLGYKLKKFSIQYSYDFTVSRAFPNTGGSSELSIVHLFKQNSKLKKRSASISCPKFSSDY